MLFAVGALFGEVRELRGFGVDQSGLLGLVDRDALAAGAVGSQIYGGFVVVMVV